MIQTDKTSAENAKILAALRAEAAVAREVRLRVYDGETLETMAADLIAFCKVLSIDRATALAEFSEIWDRTQKREDAP